MIIEKMLLCMYLQMQESALSQFVGLRFEGEGKYWLKGEKGLSEHLQLIFSQ